MVAVGDAGPGRGVRVLTPALTLALTLALVMAQVSGCGAREPEQDFERYLSRLERTLDEPVHPLPLPALPPPPRTARLLVELPGSKLDTLDFLALSGCAVQVTIGKRNSSLGRMASESQQLLLDLEYLALAPACIEQLQGAGRRALADTLAEAHRRKRAQLPARIYNATLANREYRQFWRIPPALTDYPAQTAGAVPAALKAITRAAERWLDGDYRFDNREFEIRLSEVARGDGGALALALATQSAALEAADSAIARRMARGPLCRVGLRPAAADILPNVVRRFFVGDIQTWAAAVERRRHALQPGVRELESLLAPALPQNYVDWQRGRRAAMEAWAAAPRRHVDHLQRLQAPCEDG